MGEAKRRKALAPEKYGAPRIYSFIVCCRNDNDEPIERSIVIPEFSIIKNAEIFLALSTEFLINPEHEGAIARLSVGISPGWCETLQALFGNYFADKDVTVKLVNSVGDVVATCSTLPDELPDATQTSGYDAFKQLTGYTDQDLDIFAEVYG